MEFLSYLISGISLGSVYAIIALGYTMVYGIAKMLNFAHGDVIMIGGYVSFCAMFYLGLPSIVAVLMAVVVCTVLGIVIERLAYKPLRSAPSLAVLITAIGVSYFLQNSALLIWKAAARSSGRSSRVCPPRRTGPPGGRSSAARRFRSVVLPLPLSPMTATYSPLSTEKVTLLSASTFAPPKRVV